MYHLLYGFLYLMSLLPLRVLYLFSELAFFIVYRLAGYRKEVVLKNLQIALPEKTDTEREKIAKQFYRNFTDNFIETIKLLSAGKKFLEKHFVGNTQVLFDLHKQGKKCQVHLGHNFNWEFANIAMAFYTPYTLLTVYMPISNKAVDKLFKKIRTRTGAVLLPATKIASAMLPYHLRFLLPATKIASAMLPYRDQQYMLALVADQNPGVPARAYWLNFFGKPTPFVKGPEKGARANDAAVVFAHFTKRKRGYYVAHFELATLEPNRLPEGELTKIYIQYLQRVIKANPEMWLWSHRRWKHEWKPEFGKVIA